MRGYGYGFANGTGMMGGGSWFGSALMGFLAVLFVVAVVLLIVMLVRRANGNTHGPMVHGGMMHGMGQGGTMEPPTPAHDEAVAIARRRFAAGEVTKEQFDEIMKTLG